MNKLFVIVFAAIAVVSCKGKDNSLNSDKNIVVMTDTGKASRSYLSDTGAAKMPAPAAPAAVAPVAVAPATVHTAPVVRTHQTTQHTTSTVNSNGGGSSTTTTTTAPVAAAPARPAKTGWSSAAKDATIGAVGGAVVGAIAGKGKGAIIGGVAGAGGGYILGRSKDRKTGRVQ